TQPAPVAATIPAEAKPEPKPGLKPEPAVEPSPPPVPAPVVEKRPQPVHVKKPRHEKKIASGATNPKPIDAPPAAEVPKPQGTPAQTAYKEGMALFDQGNPRGAIVKFQEAVAADHNYAEAYKALGRAYSRTGESDASKKAYRRYLEIRPNASDRVFI